MEKVVIIKTYAYIYDENGIVHANKILNEDSTYPVIILKKPFEYTNARAIKAYILKNYGF